MPITRTDRTEEWAAGKLVHSGPSIEVDITEPVVEYTLHDQADQALASLRTITATTGTLTGVQLSNAVRIMARVLIVLVRLVIRRLDDVT